MERNVQNGAAHIVVVKTKLVTRKMGRVSTVVSMGIKESCVIEVRIAKWKQYQQSDILSLN